MRYKILCVGFIIGGLVVIAMSFGSFASTITIRESYIYDSLTSCDSDIYYTDTVEGNHNYSIAISATAESYQYDSIVDATVVIYIDGVSVITDHLYDRDFYEEDDQKTLASDFAGYDFVAAASTNITITGVFIEGDQWEIMIYQDLPSELFPMEAMAMIGLIAGLVVVIVGMALIPRARRS